MAHRCNHPFCSVMTHATARTCWLESRDVPDPVKLLQLIRQDPAAICLSSTLMVEVEKFLTYFDGRMNPDPWEDSPNTDIHQGLPASMEELEQAIEDEQKEVTGEWDLDEVLRAYVRSDEGGPV